LEQLATQVKFSSKSGVLHFVHLVERSIHSMQEPVQRLQLPKVKYREFWQLVHTVKEVH